MGSRRATAVATILATLTLAAGVTAASASLVADYRFGGDLASSVAGAPEMFTNGTVGPFASETVAGCSRSSLFFADGSGLGLSTAEITDPVAFTVITQVRFDSATGYVRLLNWYPSFAVDDGLYLNNGMLDFYDTSDPETSDHAGTTVVPADSYAEFAITRSAAGRLNGYTNGIHQFSHLDTSNDAVTPHPAGNVYFFVDNADNTGEASAGAVARVRVYDSALPARQITNTEGCFNRRCAGRAVTIAGDRRPNVLIGTSGPDVIAGLGGRDTIKGLGGRDRICAHGGPDRLIGGAGRDTLLGGSGRDRLNGGPGRDRCLGGPGRDRGRRCERGRV